MKVDKNIALLDFLKEKMTDASAITFKNMLRYGRVFVNDVPIIDKTHQLNRGDEVELKNKGTFTKTVKKTAKQYHALTPIYEDSYVVAFEKPAGTLSIGTKRERGTDFFSVVKLFMATRPENPASVYWVQGLDRETSGIMLFAKNEQIQKILRTYWGAYTRKYVCLCKGIPDKETGEIEGEVRNPHAIQKNKAKGKKEKKSNPLKFSITKYKTLKVYHSYSIIEVEPTSEQKFQILSHLEDLKCPIIASRSDLKDKNLKYTAIHFHHLSFIHPILKKEVKITLPIPESFKNAAKKAPKNKIQDFDKK
jgi:23S rRNA pseudouridine1911/1915/1917 synthase